MANHKTVSGVLGSAVANAGTFTVSYPAKTAPESGTTDAGDFYNGVWHKMNINGASLSAPIGFTLTFGTSSITVTNRSGSSWPARSEYTLQIEEPGKKVYMDKDGTGSRMAAMVRSDPFLINLGAPDTADADGYFASQNLTTAGVASVSTTVAAAIAAAALAGTADVPRNVVASWTGTAVLTVTGTDAYGATIVESSASGTSFTGKKAFKTVTGISVSANVTSLTVGTGNVLGLPVYVPARSHILAELQDGVILSAGRDKINIPVQINETDTLAGTAQQFVAPVAGYITGMQVIVQKAVTTGGAVTVEANTSAVTGLSCTVADGATAGTVYTDSVERIAAGLVAAGDDCTVTPASAFNTAGAINVNVVLEPLSALNGTFVAGDTTAGGATATTGDVRGTYAPANTPDGSLVYQLLVHLPNPGEKGTSQYAG